MVRGGEERADVSLDVLWVGELTWHSDAAAQPLSDTHTSKASFPPFPSLFLLLHSTHPASGKHDALVSPSHKAKPTRAYCKNRVILWQKTKLIQKITENNYKLELHAAFYKTACLTFSLPQWIPAGHWWPVVCLVSVSLLPHCTVMVAGKSTGLCMMLKCDTRPGWSRGSHVTHFCNIANMINIADTGMQLLLPWLLQ